MTPGLDAPGPLRLPRLQPSLHHDREETIRDAARNDLPGWIFTFVLASDTPRELEYLRSPVEVFRAGGRRAVCAEL